MGVIETLVGGPIADALGWALLHSIWQLALVGAVTALALAPLRRGASDLRYLVGAVGLSLMLTLPAVTFWTTYETASGNRTGVAATTAVEEPARRPPTPPAEDAIAAREAGEAPLPAAALLSSWRIESMLPAVVAIWLAGVALLSLRLLNGWFTVERLRVRHRRPAGKAVVEMVDHLSRRLHVRWTVAAFESAAVEVPTVIGWLKPVLLLPVSALAGLTPRQLEAVLAHELAHVRRHDYLVNVLQTVVETLLFYHPAVWWLSRRVRVEREHCCDDLAVTLCGDPVGYARALANLEQSRVGRALSLAATDGSLLGRVRRLVGATAPHEDRAPAWLAAVSAVTIVLAGVAGAHALEPAGTPQPPAVKPVAALAPPAATGPVATPPALAPAGLTMPRGALPARSAVAPRAVVADQAEQSVDSVQSRGESRIVHSDGMKRFELRYRGRIALTDDDSDIKSLSPDGYLIISDGKWFWFKDYKIEIRPGANGTLERRFWVDGREQPYEPDGREWLQKSLLRLVRTSGFAADSRIARMLKAGGPGAVLDEIARLESDYVRRIYFEKLLASGTLDPPTLSRALAQAGREITSDYELSRVLRQVGQTQKIDRDDLRTAFFDAATHISSDYELQRTLAALLDRGPLDDALVARLLDTAGHLESDYEASRLLRKVVERYPLTGDSRTAFFRALDTISSDYEHQRVLAAVVARNDIDPAAVAMVLQSAQTIGSDYERARLLRAVSAKHSVDGPLRDDFFKAAAGVGSAYERQRVLASVAQKPGLGEETLVMLLQTAAGLDSDYELSRLLVLVAENNRLEGRTRDAFLDAADHIRDASASGRVMTALVRSERGR